MEIKPLEKGFFRTYAEVRIDCFDEMYALGAAAPTLSAEGQRWHRFMSRGMIPARSYPETYPTTIKIPEPVLARVAGNLMLRRGRVGRLGDEVGLSMLNEISGYFTQTSLSERSRLETIGRQDVDAYEARQQSSPET